MAEQSICAAPARAPDNIPVHELAPIIRASGVLVLPGSKSVSIRTLLLAALSEGVTELDGVLDSDDTRVMRDALAACGVTLVQRSPSAVSITGARRLPAPQADIFVGNSGLSLRTLVAVLAFMGGEYRLSGVARMHQRPIGDLVDALNQVGARIAYLAQPGFPPLAIGRPGPGSRQGLSVRGDASSQFLTGLLQAAPLLSEDGDVTIQVEGPLISRPYVELTQDLMAQFGVAVEGDAAAHSACFRVARHSRYRSPGRYVVEGDASSASYFLALGALAGGPLRVSGVGRSSRQADVAFADLLESMGVAIRDGGDWIEASSPGVAGGWRPRAFDADLNHMPDSAMTAAVLAVFADGRSRLRNIGSWRVKETDRLAAMARELVKLGARVEEGDDWLAIEAPRQLQSATFDTYDDHRMAMSLSLAACGGVPQRIRDPGCVAKTYPAYFADLARLAAGTGGA